MKLIPIVFLVLSTGIVVTLFTSVFKLMNFDFEKEPMSTKVIYKIFRLPLLFFLLLIMFIAVGIPMLEGNG